MIRKGEIHDVCSKKGTRPGSKAQGSEGKDSEIFSVMGSQRVGNEMI